MLEWSLLAGGTVCLLAVASAYIHGAVIAHQAVQSFTTVSMPEESDSMPLQSTASVDATGPVTRTGNGPLALLSIHRLSLEVPVFFGTDSITLNKGAGVVESTAIPGEEGNIAIAGHRDSFFRPLKEIQIGDVIEMRSQDAARRFVVEEVLITDALDVSVLAHTEETVLTLITCHPFHYVGYAPDRFIVRARLTSTPIPDEA